MQANEFNQKYEVGQNVIYTDDFGDKHETQTRSEAWELGSGEAVVSIKGRTGGHAISRIQVC